MKLRLYSTIMRTYARYKMLHKCAKMFSHFWDRPVPIFSDVRFSYLALVQDKIITCVLPANACCIVYVNCPPNSTIMRTYARFKMLHKCVNMLSLREIGQSKRGVIIIIFRKINTKFRVISQDNNSLGELIPTPSVKRNAQWYLVHVDYIFSYSNFSFMCMISRSLFVLLYFFFWPLCCLSFFDLRTLVTPLVSSNPWLDERHAYFYVYI
jgi:hypothetical protein